MKQRKDGKDPAAVSLGRRGGLRGGKAIAAKIGSEGMAELGRRGMASRWGKVRAAKEAAQGQAGQDQPGGVPPAPPPASPALLALNDLTEAELRERLAVLERKIGLLRPVAEAAEIVERLEVEAAQIRARLPA